MRPTTHIHRPGTLATLGLVALLAAGAASAQTTGRVDLFAGQRSLASEFAPADDATQFGFALSIGREDWPVRIAFDVMSAGDDASAATTFGGLPVTGSADVDLSEIDLGVRRFVGEGAWSWHYGGGVALVDVEVESTISDGSGTLFAGEQSDDSFGIWLAVGASWEFAERYQAGLTLRYTDAEVDLGGASDFEAGGVQLGASFGYRW